MTGARQSNPGAGIAFAILAVACFAALDTTTKFVSTGVSVVIAVWFRYAFQAVVTTAIILPREGLASLRTAHPRFQLLRGLLLLATTVFAFFSLKFMPVGEFTAIVTIVPLVVTVAAATTLGERVSPLRWLLVAGGFVGAMVIIRPGGADFSWALLLPLGLVVSNSWFQVLTSRMARTENPMVTHLYTGWVGTIACSLLLPFVWVTPGTPALWAGLLFMGLAATVGHFLLILAFTHAPAATITPYLYGQIAFAMLGGWIAFSHIPDGISLVGMAMIAVCGAIGGWLTVKESQNRIVPQPAEG